MLLSAAAPAAHVAAIHVPLANTPNKGAHATATNMVPLQVTGVAVQNGQLVLQGLLGSTAFTAPITLSTSPNAVDPTCPILNLHVGEIHLNLLGLHVDTSEICLSITAHEGGGLLGDLLCNVSKLLNGGTPLGNILGGLTGTQLTQILGGLTNLLNGALSTVTNSANVAGVGGTTPGATDILNLSLGPVDLTLLGLNVHLDNCHGGPITVGVTAVPGAGNLLGNLLANLSNLLNSHANHIAINNNLTSITNAIGALI